MQVYNLFHQLQEDNLHYLTLFTEYGRLIFEEGIHCKPFQRLTFLIRDWFSPNDFDFGREGGKEYLIKKFRPKIKSSTDSSKTNGTSKKLQAASDKNSHENMMTRKHIQRCFDKLDCFLLPHPGKYVSSSNNYNGNWGDMQYEYYVKLKEFIEWWFTDLQTKRSTDYVPHKLTGSEFISFFKLLTSKLSEHKSEIIKPITIFESMAKISHLQAIDECVKQYQLKMQTLFGKERPFVWPSNIDKISKYLEDQHRTVYLKKKKFGSRQYEHLFIARLNDQFKDITSYFQNLNQLKCTVLPAYLLIICTIVITHLLASLFKFILNLWFLNQLIQWLLTFQFALLSLAVAVEVLGFRYGSSFVGLMRKNLQCIYHLTRAKPINLSILNDN